MNNKLGSMEKRQFHAYAENDLRKKILVDMHLYKEALENRFKCMSNDNCPVTIFLEREMMCINQFLENSPWKLENGELLSYSDLLTRESRFLINAIKDNLEKKSRS